MTRYELHVNGQAHTIDGEPGDSLLSVLRYELGLTGSRFGCGEGQCGSCTVLMDGVATRACVTRLIVANGKQITTIESLSEGDHLHPVQDAFLEAEAFQCGYCTSGMVMATVALLRSNPDPTDADIAKAMDRNICRCGTYPRIVRAVKTAAARMKGTVTGGAR